MGLQHVFRNVHGVRHALIQTGRRSTRGCKQATCQALVGHRQGGICFLLVSACTVQQL